MCPFGVYILIYEMWKIAMGPRDVWHVRVWDVWHVRVWDVWIWNMP